MLERLFDAQVQSRHLDFAARWLQKQGKGYYTIGSAGHESNAAVGLLSRSTDPALLHYRSGGFYAARAAVAGADHPVRDVLLSLTSATSDPMSGGRHKVFGHPALGIIPQTSTIASHLPRAVGLGYSLGLARAIGHESPWPADAIVVCSFGDASVNHSTAAGAFNAAAYLTHRGIRARCCSSARTTASASARGLRRGGRRPRSQRIPGSATGTPTGRSRCRSSTSWPSRWLRSASGVVPPSCT